MVQDLHTHTVFSDGIDSVARISHYAHQHNIQIGIADHILCKKMCDKSSIINYFKTLDEYHVLKGAEIDLGETGALDDYLIDNSDYIIGSIHNIRMNGENIKFGKYFDSRAGEQILNRDFVFNDNTCCKALENILLVIRKELTTNPIDILGHCTVNPFYEQVNSKYKYEWEQELISLCKSTETAIEISGLWMEPSIDFIKRAIDRKVKVTFGSDCHELYSDKYFDYYIFIFHELGLSERDVKRIGKR